jgi:type II secretory pathway component PulL
MRTGHIRFLKVLLILSVLLGAGYVCNKVIKDNKSIREVNKRINPEIFPAFQRIENYAYEYVMKEEVNRVRKRRRGPGRPPGGIKNEAL